MNSNKSKVNSMYSSNKITSRYIKDEGDEK